MASTLLQVIQNKLLTWWGNVLRQYNRCLKTNTEELSLFYSLSGFGFPSKTETTEAKLQKERHINAPLLAITESSKFVVISIFLIRSESHNPQRWKRF